MPISKESWDKLTPEEKEEIRELYSDLIKAMSGEGVGSDAHIVLSMVQDRYISLFGKEHLKPKLTYEDVAEVVLPENREGAVSVSIPVFSQEEANKLSAIGALLATAKYLNGDWKPDWKDAGQPKWHIYINHTSLNNDLGIEEYYQDCIAPVYFRTESLARQAIDILGENTVRLALGDY